VEPELLMGMAALSPDGDPAPGDRGTNTLWAAPAFSGAKTLSGLSQVPKARWLPVPPAPAVLPSRGCASWQRHSQHWSQRGATAGITPPHGWTLRKGFPQTLALFGMNPSQNTRFALKHRQIGRTPAVGGDTPGARRQPSRGFSPCGYGNM